MPDFHQLDIAALHALYGGNRSEVLTALVIAVTTLGGGWGMLGLLPLLARRRSRGVATAMTLVLLVTALIVLGLKGIVGRVRPCLSVPGIHALWGAPTDCSFPSGHTTGSFAFAAYVATVMCAKRSYTAPARALLIAAAFLFAVGVGLSRIYLGVHYPSDVLASAFLGATLGVVGARLTRRKAVA